MLLLDNLSRNNSMYEVDWKGNQDATCFIEKETLITGEVFFRLPLMMLFPEEQCP